MTRRARWAWIISLVALTGAGLVLMFLLSITTNNRQLYERHFVWLTWVNLAIAVLLGLVICGAAVRLLLRVRQRKFGSRLLLKLAAIFALVGVLPGALIYTVSYQFVSRSIESWFDVKVEGALEAGLNLGRVTLDTMVQDLSLKTRLASERLADMSAANQSLQLASIREQLGAQEVSVLSATGQTVLTASAGNLRLAPPRPSSAQLREARNLRVIAQLEGLDEEAGGVPASPRIRALALMEATNFSLSNEPRFLQVTQLVPASLAANALSVQQAYREYQERALGREGLRRMYIGTLTLTLFLAVFGALLLAVVLGQQLARPLLLLAEGMRQVARGDLTPKQVMASRDELGGLTRSFADMTSQLSEARALAQRSLGELEEAKTYLQTILDNLTAGVLVCSSEGIVEMVNPGATHIVRAPIGAYRGRPLADVPGLARFAAEVEQQFGWLASSISPDEPRGRDHWQHAIELTPEEASSEPVTLLARGAWLPEGRRLIVFDDISDVISAQRSQAWGEVARRLAHEIKNPLTPIQLSAERLQMKLAPKLGEPDQPILNKSVTTIVNQVAAMKRLVDEFRDYARLPAAELRPLDLNALVGDVLSLYGQDQEAGRVRAQLATSLPAIQGDATQLRQVIHNLLQNALDAVEGRPDPRVTVRTEVIVPETTGVVPSDTSALRVRLSIGDNGTGFAEKILKRAFEPYVTTKTKGTGLGLAVVKKIADEHGARIALTNRTAPDDPTRVTGAVVSLLFSKLADARSEPVAPKALPASA